MQDQPSNFSSPPQLPASTALATTSLVLGILALVLSLFIIGGFLGLVGLVLGAIYLGRKKAPRAMAWWGVSLSILSIVASVGFGTLYYFGYKEFRKAMAEGISTDSSDSPKSWEGVIAPDITVTTLDGESLQLSSLQGKRVVLDFWATWCGPCVKEIPHFIQLINETSREELVIVGISKEEVSKLEPFVKKHGINYPIASASDLPSPYGAVTAIPTTFFIDRNGVIQTVLTGYHDLESLREHAVSDDFKGEAMIAPTPVGSKDLIEKDTQLQATELWSTNGISGEALCSGDWDGDGVMDILVSTSDKKLRVFDVDGTEKSTVTLPQSFKLIEAGNSKGNFRLLGYSIWGKEVIVMDKNGKQLWSYDSGPGINGAHWGDLDGDGDDEMVIGMNGAGGLHAVSPAGKKLWKASLGNAWNQAAIPAKGESPALVFATEAGGSIKVFDAQGKLLRTIKPNEEYFSQMTAARLNDGTIQGIASGEITAAFDVNGNVIWSTPSKRNSGAWMNISFAVGDVDGDGSADWAFHEPNGDLVLVSTSGEKLATLTGKLNASFILVPDKSGKAMLVRSTSTTLEAYRFE